jgi:hypothetical protein
VRAVHVGIVSQIVERDKRFARNANGTLIAIPKIR